MIYACREIRWYDEKFRGPTPPSKKEQNSLLYKRSKRAINELLMQMI